ncbi:helix-turn-helix domain-containing protein [Oceanobacter antarcticus]|uniref:Helix-turn-helix domain-containing protein n=1 Tax=Oceanobacter antarcticus TaxID=3133425 RepID=A0ABW8NNE7_9GAMM
MYISKIKALPDIFLMQINQPSAANVSKRDRATTKVTIKVTTTAMQPTNNHHQIPTVHQYGDNSSGFTPDLLHCETLSLRSRQHQFTIRPHRHQGLTQLFCLTRGSGEANIDGGSFTAEAPTVIAIAALCIHDFLWSEDVEGFVLSLSHSLMAQLDGSATWRITQRVDDASACEKIASYMHGLLEEYHATADEQRGDALKSWLQLITTVLARQHYQQAVKQTPGWCRENRYLTDFTCLINRDYARQRTTASYAAELGISAPHLNSLCKQQLHRTALSLIHERLTLEACRSLSYTIQPVSAIAYQLGFQDPAYFTRFFRRQTGLSPSQYRQQSEA